MTAQSDAHGGSLAPTCRYILPSCGAVGFSASRVLTERQAGRQVDGKRLRSQALARRRTEAGALFPASGMSSRGLASGYVAQLGSSSQLCGGARAGGGGCQHAVHVRCRGLLRWTSRPGLLDALLSAPSFVLDVWPTSRPGWGVRCLKQTVDLKLISGKIPWNAPCIGTRSPAHAVAQSVNKRFSVRSARLPGPQVRANTPVRFTVHPAPFPLRDSRPELSGASSLGRVAWPSAPAGSGKPIPQGTLIGTHILTYSRVVRGRR